MESQIFWRESIYSRTKVWGLDDGYLGGVSHLNTWYPFLTGIVYLFALFVCWFITSSFWLFANWLSKQIVIFENLDSELVWRQHLEITSHFYGNVLMTFDSASFYIVYGPLISTGAVRVIGLGHYATCVIHRLCKCWANQVVTQIHHWHMLVTIFNAL